jgi:hypothetical protein
MQIHIAPVAVCLLVLRKQFAAAADYSAESPDLIERPLHLQALCMHKLMGNGYLCVQPPRRDLITNSIYKCWVFLYTPVI